MHQHTCTSKHMYRHVKDTGSREENTRRYSARSVQALALWQARSVHWHSGKGGTCDGTLQAGGLMLAHLGELRHNTDAPRAAWVVQAANQECAQRLQRVIACVRAQGGGVLRMQRRTLRRCPLVWASGLQWCALRADGVLQKKACAVRDLRLLAYTPGHVPATETRQVHAPLSMSCLCPGMRCHSPFHHRSAAHRAALKVRATCLPQCLRIKQADV